MTDTRGDGGSGAPAGEPMAPESRGDAIFNLAGVGRDEEVAVFGFAAGTMIATPDGDRAVETLAAGDQVATSTGRVATLRGVRQRKVPCDGAACPNGAWPIRIAAHAFAEGRPARDLRLAPGSRLRIDLVGEMLIPVAPLVNAATIARDEVDRVDYVDYRELDLETAAAVLADGLAVEVESGDGARPPTYDGGPVIEALRLRLRAGLDASGWRRETSPFAGLHLLVDGERVGMRTAELAACALVPVTARNVWLVSHAATPSTVSDSSDQRLLGVPLAALSIDDGLSPRRPIALDDPRLCVGFHEPEAGRRWTTGRARLPFSLWEGCEGHAFVRVDLEAAALPRWVRAAAETMPVST